MLYKTRGVVFRFTKYGETSIVVTIFTELFGIQSYIVNGVRSKSTKNKIALYQQLTLLDLVVYHRENANLLRIKEIKCLHPYQTIFSDIKKSTIALFINEVINKAIREESHAQLLCDFLIQSLIMLDSLTTGSENFHLLFLVKLSRHLGFGAYSKNDMLTHSVVSPQTEELLDKMLTAEYTDPIHLTNQDRRELLHLILKFYTLHVDNFGELKSLQVLREVIS